MSKHNVGNCYSLLGHVLELEEISENFPMQNRCKFSCRTGGKCCTWNSGIDMTCHLNDLDNMELVKEVASPGPPPAPFAVLLEDIVEVRKGWDRAGTRFTVLGPMVFQQQWWVPVNDPDEEDPTYFKAAGLRKV